MNAPDPPAAPVAPRAAGWWLHPMLVAAFPVVYLFATNIREQLSLEPLWTPLAIVIGMAAATLLLAVVVGRLLGVDPARSALVASLLLLLALTYGHAWNLVGELAGLHRVLLIAWAVLAVMGIVVIAFLRAGAIARLTTAVNVFAGILIVTNLVPIGDLLLRTSSIGEPTTESPQPGQPARGTGRDVWYLVFDRYAGSPALRELFGFDNGPFLDALRERGFVVAEGATANYLKTAHSLASSLNMEELDADALASEASTPDDWTPLYRRLQTSHAVERFLHDRGYRYLHLGLRRGATYANEAADVTFLLGNTTEFSAVLADTTMLIALEEFLPDEVAIGTDAIYPAQTLFQLQELDRIADTPGRNFVFAHLLLPHPPYVFNADGSRVTAEQRASRTDDELYIEQLRYANARILALLDRLQAGPPDSWPIVVLAADEGPFPPRYAADEAGFAWGNATPEELLRKFSILTAVSVPGVDAAALEAAGFSDTITPLNLFRTVFNAAFDAGLPILPDRNWIFVDQRHLYDLVDVTEQVRH
ncbi:MAG TPA: hypothetical protein VEW95_04810 [Candidatus Limnocylindrales bacterium]|nr:hypothetical protein [Candidatus Limnocylindrales bacterium]